MSNANEHTVEKQFSYLLKGFRGLSGNPDLCVWEVNEMKFIFALNRQCRPGDWCNPYEFDKGVKFFINKKGGISAHLKTRVHESEPPRYDEGELFDLKVLVDPRGNTSCSLPGHAKICMEDFVRNTAYFLEGTPPSMRSVRIYPSATP